MKVFFFTLLLIIINFPTYAGGNKILFEHTVDSMNWNLTVAYMQDFVELSPQNENQKEKNGLKNLKNQYPNIDLDNAPSSDKLLQFLNNNNWSRTQRRLSSEIKKFKQDCDRSLSQKQSINNFKRNSKLNFLNILS